MERAEGKLGAAMEFSLKKIMNGSSSKVVRKQLYLDNQRR